jgi:ubiquinol-cytochrome c reductase iron-sulfur subunit
MSATSTGPDNDMRRRKFLYAATASFAAIGAAAALWPLIDQMNPAASVKPPEIDVDLSSIQPGNAITVSWQGKPIFIRNRTKEEIEKARAAPLDALLDTDARVMDAENPLTATDENRTKPGKKNWLLVVGICTRDSCLLQGQKAGEWRGDYGGWFCPCCAAHYDTSGRTRTGIARQNLRVPPYRFTGESRLTIGCGLCRAAFLVS